MMPFARLDRGFRGYLKRLIDSGRLEKESSKVSLGIAGQVLNDGLETLTARQAPVFYEYVLGRFVIKKCNFCNNDIRWSEMYAALDNEGFCKDCAKAHQEILKKKATKNKKSKKTSRK